MSRVACCMLHVACCTSHIAHRTSHTTHTHIHTHTHTHTHTNACIHTCILLRNRTPGGATRCDRSDEVPDLDAPMNITLGRQRSHSLPLSALLPLPAGAHVRARTPCRLNKLRNNPNNRSSHRAKLQDSGLRKWPRCGI